MSNCLGVNIKRVSRLPHRDNKIKSLQFSNHQGELARISRVHALIANDTIQRPAARACAEALSLGTNRPFTNTQRHPRSRSTSLYRMLPITNPYDNKEERRDRLMPRSEEENYLDFFRVKLKGESRIFMIPKFGLGMK